jgi:hypothetical protein
MHLLKPFRFLLFFVHQHRARILQARIITIIAGVVDRPRGGSDRVGGLIGLFKEQPTMSCSCFSSIEEK